MCPLSPPSGPTAGPPGTPPAPSLPREGLEREIAELRERYREVEQIAGVGSWEWDVVSGRVEWTEEMYRILGYAPFAFPAETDRFMSLIHPEDRVEVERAIREAIEARRPFEVRHRLARPDGEVRRILGRGRVVTDEAGTVLRLVGTTQDVTTAYEATERARQLAREHARRLEAEAGELRLRAILEGISDAFVSLDRAWRYTYVNARAGDFFGRDPASLVGREIWAEFPYLVDHPTGREIERAMRERRPTTLEGYFAHLQRWVECRVHPSEEGLAVFFSDVTEQRRAARVLRESEQKLQAILDHAPAIVYAKDLAGRYVLVNRAHAEFFGLTADQVLGRTDAEALGPFEPDVYAAHDRQVLSTGSVLQFEESALVAGERRTVLSVKFPLRHPDGEIYAICGISTDITDRKRTEQALLASEERFRLAARATRDLVYDWDVRGDTLAWSEALQTVFGYPADLTRSDLAWWTAAIHPDDEPAVTASLNAWLRAGAPSWEAEYRFRRHDGSYAFVRERGYAVADESGEVARVVGSIADVTDARAREEQLRRAERLAGLGTLVGGVAHELNNPLAAIKSFAQLMLLEPRSPEDREALQVMEREASRAAKIVTDLRRVTRESQDPAAPREPVALNDVIRHVLRVRDYTFRTHNVDTQVDLAPDLPAVTGNRSELEQVVVNLVVNAEQAMTGQAGPKRLRVSTRRGLKGIVLSVSDSGPGIPAQSLARIFDPFFTTKEPGEGTGLGLSLVHSIVTAHGGELNVESEPGRGATFRVTLPVAAETADAGAAEAETARGVSGRRVLVVDDEPGIRRALSRYLRRLGHEVVEAGDGAEALALLHGEDAVAFDAVLSDLRMPGLSGERLLTELQRRDPVLARRVILMTGDAASDQARSLLERLGTPVLLKPFELEEAAAMIEALTG